MARYPRIDWTGRDYDSLRTEAIAFIRGRVPSWTDFSSSNTGVALIELVCYLCDLLGYYQDAIGNEAMPILARERANVIEHMRLIAYRLSSAHPASVTVRLSLDEPTGDGSATSVPAKTVITTGDGSIRFETVSSATVPGDGTYAEVSAVEGETWEEEVGQSTGQASQRFQLARTPFIYVLDSLTAPAEVFSHDTCMVDAVAWTRVDDFLSSAANDTHYTIEVDSDDQATVCFGDGVNGAIPIDGAHIVMTYRTGGGEAGNVDVSCLSQLDGSFVSETGLSVTVIATNPSAATGGTERESTDHAKLHGPRSVRSAGRSVARTDFQDAAEAVPGVLRVLAMSRRDQEDSGGIVTIPENAVIIYVIPSGGGEASAALLAAIKAYCTDTRPRTLTQRLLVGRAVRHDVTIAGTVHLLTGYEPADVSAAIQAALSAHYDPGAEDTDSGDYLVQWGAPIAVSQLHHVIHQVDGVDYVELTTPAYDVALEWYEFPRLGTVTLAMVEAS